MNTMNSDTNNDRQTPITDATVEEFKRELDAKLSATTDEQLRAELEAVGCDFAMPADLERQLSEVTGHRDTLAEALKNIRANAVNPCGIKWGWDGDRGSGRIIEQIIEITDVALAALKGGRRE